MNKKISTFWAMFIIVVLAIILIGGVLAYQYFNNNFNKKSSIESLNSMEPFKKYGCLKSLSTGGSLSGLYVSDGGLYPEGGNGGNFFVVCDYISNFQGDASKIGLKFAGNKSGTYNKEGNKIIKTGGEISGTAELNGDTAIFQISKVKCVVKFNFSDNKLTVEEVVSCGQDNSYSGTYTKQ